MKMYNFKEQLPAKRTVPTRPTKDVIQQRIDAVINFGHGLVDYEKDFISDINDQLKDIGSLNQIQEEILERIYERKTYKEGNRKWQQKHSSTSEQQRTEVLWACGILKTPEQWLTRVV
jgi:cell shape-determining protein MreC